MPVKIADIADTALKKAVNAEFVNNLRLCGFT
jgi:hypothetical protein